jgi:hypothetical protein
VTLPNRLPTGCSRKSLSARAVRTGRLGCTGQAEELGASRAQALDRGGQEAAAATNKLAASPGGFWLLAETSRRRPREVPRSLFMEQMGSAGKVVTVLCCRANRVRARPGRWIHHGAKQCEARAKKGRDLESRDWHTTVARAYRMLAEAENEVAARRRPTAA